MILQNIHGQQTMQFNKPQEIPSDILSIDQIYVKQEVFSDTGNGQGKVFLVSRNSNLYAAKLFKNKNEYKHQVKFMLQLQAEQNRFVTKLQHHSQRGKIIRQDNSVVYISVIIMEFALHGDFFDFIADSIKQHTHSQQKLFRIPLNICKNIFKQLLIGVNSLHDKKILHRDIKTQNILISQNFQIKIGDFGFAARLNQFMNDLPVGTKQFSSPESIKRLCFVEKSDLFSCGVFLFNICTSFQLPFPSCFKKVNFIGGKIITQYTQEYQKFALQKNHKSLDTLWNNIKNSRKLVMPEEFKDLFKKVFIEDLSKRPTINQVLQSQFFKQEASTTQMVEFFNNQYERLIKSQNSKRLRIIDLIERVNNQGIHQMAQNGLRDLDEMSQNNLQFFVDHYEKQYIHIQQFQVSNYSRLTKLKSKPAFVLGWLSYFMNEKISKQDLCLFVLLVNQKIKSHYVRFSNINSMIQINLQVVQAGKQQKTQNQFEYENQQKVQNIVVNGRFLSSKLKNHIQIEWIRNKQFNCAAQLLVRDLKELIEALAQYEKSSNQTKN